MKLRSYFLLIVVSAILFVNQSYAIASFKINLKVEKYKLSNGLTVLLHEDHSVPLISYHTWYKVGSRDESQGVTGAAHMLEHMMFKGAKKYDSHQFDLILHENGMNNNAFTTYDYTGFYQNLPSDKLELMMDIEVDRMAALNLRSEDLQSEREVVKEERRWRIDNSPMGVLREESMNFLFQNHPYKHPVIGTMEDISNYNIEKLSYFYQKFYIPNNAILVLSGDFDSQKVRPLIEKYYGSLKAKELPERHYEKEIPQKNNKFKKIYEKVQSPTISMSYLSVPQGHKDMYALDLLSQILGGSSSSRLHKTLVYEKQFSLGAYAYNMTMNDYGVFSIGSQIKPNKNPEDVLKLLRSEIEFIKNHGVSKSELDRAKTQSIKSVVDSLLTIDGKARVLASAEIVTGSYENLFNDLNKYNEITSKDIQYVAKKYLSREYENTILLLPENDKK